MEVKNQRIILTKLSDDVFEGKHPNGYYAGCTRLGAVLSPPVVGEKYYVMGRHLGDTFQTSVVTEIVSITNDEIIFKTQNSTYKIEKYEDRPVIENADS